MEFKNERLDRLSRHALLTPALLALAAVCLGMLALWFAPPYELRGALFVSYLTHPLILLLNVLPPLLLSLLIYFLTGRAGLSFLFTSALTIGLALANYYKLTFRNDPVIFEDLLLVREAGQMAGEYRLFLNLSIVTALLLVLLGWLFLHFFARARTPWKPRLICLGAFLLLSFSLTWLYQDPNLYVTATVNYDHINTYSSSEVYLSKGFIYPFLYSAGYASDKPPQGYSEREAKALLEDYEDTGIPENKKVDLFAIQLEAFADFSRLGTPELAPSVYEKFHALEAESYSGNLVTNIFAGGTVNTERCFLTGLTYLPGLRVPTSSYVWYLKNQGYATEGSHSCYGWFYDRQHVNANLGFENYYFSENRYEALAGSEIGYDDVLFPDLLTLYREHRASSDAPYFSFNVTYQGHGPYSEDTNWHGENLLKNGAAFDEATFNVLNNYFWSIRDTGNYMADFVDSLRSSKSPVVVVFYGDHMPWMGDNNSIYNLLGVSLDTSTMEGFMNYYSTRYLIWANDAAKAVLENDFLGKGPDLSPNFLMDEVFRLCGWEGPAYMQASRDFMEKVSVVNTDSGLFLEDGALTDTLSVAGEELFRNYKYMQYYWRRSTVK